MDWLYFYLQQCKNNDEGYKMDAKFILEGIKQQASVEDSADNDDLFKDYILDLHDFAYSTKSIREQLAKELNEKLHRRIAVECSRTGVNEYRFEVYIYDYNNFDYEMIVLNYKPDTPIDKYFNSILSVYTDPEMKQKYVFNLKLTSNEKLFLTWIQSTGMDKYFSLSPEGVICTELDETGFPEDGYNEVFIQDFKLTFDENVCMLSHDELGRYILSSKGIEKVS